MGWSREVVGLGCGVGRDGDGRLDGGEDEVAGRAWGGGWSVGGRVGELLA